MISTRQPSSKAGQSNRLTVARSIAPPRQATNVLRKTEVFFTVNNPLIRTKVLSFSVIEGRFSKSILTKVANKHSSLVAFTENKKQRKKEKVFDALIAKKNFFDFHLA